MPDTDWRISSLLSDSVTQFEEHAKRIESILNDARKKFEKDHTGTTAAVGIVLLGASVALAYLGRGIVVATAGIIGGITLLVLALLLRHRIGESQIKHAKTMVDLERERAAFSQRSAVLQHIWLHGLPEGTPLAQIQILLGDRSSVPADESGEPLRWRALPPQKSTNDNGETKS